MRRDATARARLEAALARLAREDPLLATVVETAGRSRVRLLLVGGIPRDVALRLPPRDADFVLAGGSPLRRRGFLRALARRLGRRVVTFRKRGIVDHRISIDGRDHDFVELRRGRLTGELRRRDFTINAVAFDLRNGRLHDPCGGLRDLSARRLRANSRSVFRYDPVRMLRAVRLRCELPRFSIATRTLAMIRRDVALIGQTAPERIRDELDRILASPRASQGIALLDRLGLLGRLMPEIAPLRRLAQNRYHHLDAWRHTLASLRAADNVDELARPLRDAGRLPSLSREDRLLLRWALLLHDLGKAGTRTVGEDGEFHFFGHEKLSGTLGFRVMRRLLVPTRRLRAVRRQIELHLRVAFPPQGDPSDKACRRLIRDAAEMTPLLILHSLADKTATKGAGWKRSMAGLLRASRRLLEMYQASGREIISPPRLVDGHDVMRLLGIGPGVMVGRLLAEIQAGQAAGEIATREQALAFIATFRSRT
jgi:poly(A) polymerase